MSQNDATVKENRQKVIAILNARIDHLKQEIVRLQSKQRLESHSALVASIRAGKEAAGERLLSGEPYTLDTPSIGFATPSIGLSIERMSSLLKRSPSYAKRIEDARKEIKEIENHLTDLNEGDLDSILDDLLREATKSPFL